MRRLFLVIPILVAGAPAHADPCADARAELRRKDYVRASIDAAACGDDALIADVDARAGKAGWSKVDVLTDPDGSTVVVEPAPDRPFATPGRIWMAEGRYTVTALMNGEPMVETLVVVREGSDARVFLTLPPPPDAPTDGVVDMGEEGGGEMSSGPPPKVELPSLLPERYRQGVDARRNPLDGQVVPARGRRRWIAAVGPAFVSVNDGGDLLGGSVLLSRSFRAGIEIAPTVVGSVVYGGDFAARVRVEPLVKFLHWSTTRIRSTSYIGPSFGFDRGNEDLEGASMGVGGTWDLEWPSGFVVAAHGDVTLLTTADARSAQLTVLAGRCW